MASGEDPMKLSMPRVFLARMLVFLALAGFVAFMLHKQIERAFMANPGLNGLILGVLAIGIVMALAAVIRLFGEARWVNDGEEDGASPPRLLAPLAAFLRSNAPHTAPALRAILDSIGARLDESREILRYMTGLMIFLGLLGTFWGLLETIGSIGDVINAMKGGGDSSVMFEDLKNGIARPLAGMSLSFTASLFGLAGSLVLGFLDLQVGQAQNRFFTEMEDRLSMRALAAPALETPEPPIRQSLDKTAAPPDTAAAAHAMASLAEGVQALVQHMRAEQQIIRNWVEQQAEQNREVKRALERLAEKEKL